MSLRFLFGPERLPAQRLPEALRLGQAAAFSPEQLASAGSWADLTRSLPDGFLPDFLVLDLSYQIVPPWIASVPVPVIGLAGDSSLLWHGYRCLPGIDLVLADTASVERFQRHESTPALAANLYGVEQVFLDEGGEDGPRDIDVLFCGNLSPAVQLERLPWLARLARLRDRFNIQIVTNAWGADYRVLMRRARIVFNRSARSEWNRRTSETLAAGALAMIERDNREVPLLLQDRVECVFYDDSDLEALVEHYLTHEAERQAIARAGHLRAAEFSFEAQWQRTLAQIEAQWPALLDRARVGRISKPSGAARTDWKSVPPRVLLARTWRAASANLGMDASLVADLRLALEGNPHNADLHNALGVAVGVAASAGGEVRSEAARLAFAHFRDAVSHDNRHLVAALNLVESLIGIGQDQFAAEAARQTLLLLDRDHAAVPGWLDAPRFPPGFDLFFVEWQKAGWDHPGQPAAEARAKRGLLRWRLHVILARLTGDMAHDHEAVNARPDLPLSRARLGCALARGNRAALAVTHLRAAVEANPFDIDPARALYQSLLDCGDSDGASRFARDQALLAQAAPGVVPVEPWFAGAISSRSLNVQTLTAEEMTARFGVLDTSQAIHSFTPPIDTHIVLTLLAHLKPQRILEIGTAEGHMTANLTEWSPEDATVYTLGTTRDMQGACRPEQQGEAPPREVLGRLAGHFGKGDKVCAITADSVSYNFKRLTPLDFAFIDGAHDLDHVLADTRNVYAALRAGGCMVWHDFGSATPWVQVDEALGQANLAEPIQHVAGTQVAFLFKQEAPALPPLSPVLGGEGLGVRGSAAREIQDPLTPNPSPPQSRGRGEKEEPLRLIWEGGIAGLHSLALVNRELCRRLVESDLDLSILPVESHPIMGIPELPLPSCLTSRFRRLFSRPAEVHVRHRWPMDVRPPAAGHFVVMQPWEFGSIPRQWAEALLHNADEIWTPTKYVRDCFVEGGIPAERVAVVPLGVDVALYRPEATPLSLMTKKRFKFLFVGGTIKRKGIDVLLAAYGKGFTAFDDVCLVIKDMGNGTFYKGQTAEEQIAAFRAEPNAPDIEYHNRALSFEELAGLYTACDCLVQPYRGEGFGLPIAEAMACGKPVVVTSMGAALDFCNDGNAYLIPAQRVTFAERHVGGQETVGFPWWAEPDADALVALMRRVVASPNEAHTRGAAGCEHVRTHLTWDHAAAVVEERLRELRKRPIVRFQPRPVPSTNGVSQRMHRTGRMRVSLTMIVKNEEANLGDCLNCIHDLVDEIVIVDTGSTDRTKEIALSFGPKVKVLDFPWIDDFAAARNKALEHATGDFIFWLDADDRMDAANRDKLRALFAKLPDANVAYSLKCLCPADPSGHFPTVVDHIRIFRNHRDIRWRYRVHEQILGAVRGSGGDVRWEDVVIVHVGYQDAAVRARKLQRDLRLLRLAIEQDPNEPFTLFNLGMVHHELGQHEQALVHLQHSLHRSNPHDSIVRKLYALIAACYLNLRRKSQALNAFNDGLTLYPDDAELLYRQALLLRDMGDLARAEANLLRLLSTKPEPHFASTDPTLRGWRGRHELATTLLMERRHADAQAQWRQVVREAPGHFPAWLGLADVAIALGDAGELEQVAMQVEQRFEGGVLQAALLRGRLLLGRGDLAGARTLADRLIVQYPQDVGPHVIRARVLRLEGHDRQAEEEWRRVLLLAPGHDEAQAHLSELLRQHGRVDDAYFQNPLP